MEYGDIMEVKTIGASKETANAYGLAFYGKKASQKMAQDDLGNMEKYKTIIKNVAKSYGVDPALIAGIISRESEAGHSISNTNPPGWGDNYKAFGLMQVDVTSDGGNHEERGAWDSEEHLDQATGILVYFIKRIQKKFPSCSTEEQLKGGIAAYNQGDGAVHSYEDVDTNTTSKDYANDVVARAQWYKENLFKIGFLEKMWSWFG